MGTEDVRAEPGWLALREDADAAARSDELVAMLRRHLPDDGLVIHDLGCGTGSMARWLAGRLSGPQRWVLHDRDAELLEHALVHLPGPAADGAAVTVETRLDDITRLAPEELAGASLLTASALLDMFTEDDLRRFVAVCAAAGCPVLVTLSVVGRLELVPEEPLDRPLREAFNAHQTRRTDRGRLLGPDAADAAVTAFEQRGRHVVVRSSPWRLGPAQAPLSAAWLEGWVRAACEQDPGLGDRARGYARRRLADLTTGSASVTVHHRDILVLGAGQASRHITL